MRKILLLISVLFSFCASAQIHWDGSDFYVNVRDTVILGKSINRLYAYGDIDPKVLHWELSKDSKTIYSGVDAIPLKPYEDFGKNGLYDYMCLPDKLNLKIIEP